MPHGAISPAWALDCACGCFLHTVQLTLPFHLPEGGRLSSNPRPPANTPSFSPLLPTTLHLNSILLSDNLGKPLVFNCCWNPPEGMVCRSLGVVVVLLSCGGDRHISAFSLLPSQFREYPSMKAVVGFSYIFPSCIPDRIPNILHSSLRVFTGHRRRPHLSWKTKQRHKNICLCSQSGF